jgi:hypothetical protein
VSVNHCFSFHGLHIASLMGHLGYRGQSTCARPHLQVGPRANIEGTTGSGRVFAVHCRMSTPNSASRTWLPRRTHLRWDSRRHDVSPSRWETETRPLCFKLGQAEMLSVVAVEAKFTHHVASSSIILGPFPAVAIAYIPTTARTCGSYRPSAAVPESGWSRR